MIEPTHLKKIRKQLNLTQHAFAQKAGISQSMVAKIESGKLDPTYSYVKKIQEALATMTKQEELKAGDIMTKRVISVTKDTPIRDVVNILTKHNISQVPVLDNHTVVGLITETCLLHAGEGDRRANLAEDVMVESPPIISKHAQLSAFRSLLEFYPLIVVSESTTLLGVITKADVLKRLVK